MQKRQQRTCPESAIQILSTEPCLEEPIHTAIRIAAQRGEIRSARRRSGNAHADARSAGGYSRRRGLGRQRGRYQRTDSRLAVCSENEREQESNAGIRRLRKDVVRTHPSLTNPVKTGKSGCDSQRKERGSGFPYLWRWAAVIRNLGGRGKSDKAECMSTSRLPRPSSTLLFGNNFRSKHPPPNSIPFPAPGPQAILKAYPPRIWSSLSLSMFLFPAIKPAKTANYVFLWLQHI